MHNHPHFNHCKSAKRYQDTVKNSISSRDKQKKDASGMAATSLAPYTTGMAAVLLHWQKGSSAYNASPSHNVTLSLTLEVKFDAYPPQTPLYYHHAILDCSHWPSCIGLAARLPASLPCGISVWLATRRSCH